MSDRDVTYEFRIWDKNIQISPDDLTALFGSPRREARTDLYWPPKEPYLPKFRSHDRLELKERIAKKGGLDIWKRSVSAEFPIPERDLKAFCVCSPELPLAANDFASFEAAMNYLMNKVPLLPVTKQRALYQATETGEEKAEIEVSEILVLGKSHTTLAIECSSKDAALDLVSQLNLFEFDNMSYLDWFAERKGFTFDKSV
ncbi:hypothetical protein [Litorimonas sp.]|uniref:hypothetical protein n=1 Tax=Litorimonas sp. TaxID=1892381 RepID=UPI003A85F17C